MAKRSGTGQGGKSMQDRELAARVRKLTLLEIEKALKGKNKEFKQQVILRLASSILPRLTEMSGPDGKPIPLFNYVRNNNSDKQDSETKEEDSCD